MVSGLSIKERMYIVLKPTYGELVAIERMAFLYIGNDMTQRHYERRRSVECFSHQQDRNARVEIEDGESMVEQGDS